jgi:hypothetical protein
MKAAKLSLFPLSISYFRRSFSLIYRILGKLMLKT